MGKSWKGKTVRTLFLASLLFSVHAFATTKAIFVSVGKEVRIFIQSNTPSDSDAVKFFEMLQGAEKNDGSTVKKSASFVNNDGIVTDFSCSMSAKLRGAGYCQIVLRPSANAKIDGANKLIDFQVTDGGEVLQFLRVLNLPNTSNPVYISGDGHLSIDVHNKVVPNIIMQYQE